MSHEPTGHEKERFSIWLFVVTIITSLAILFCLLWLFTPTMLAAELRSGWKLLLLTFLGAHLLNAFVEFFFHRYVLHAPVVPIFAHFYKQHTLHHALTAVKLPRTPVHGETPGVINHYPILEEKQHEASFFPRYSLLLFAALGTVFVCIPVKLVFPSLPVFIMSYSALAFSLVLYELLHALEHKPITSWEPFLTHPTYGPLFKILYAFHLRHHADIHSNESISGFFGIPLPDFIFGTWVNPHTLYRHREQVDPKEFMSPTPRFIGWLDRYAASTIQKRRAHMMT